MTPTAPKFVVLATFLVLPTVAAAQGVVVDQGRFRVSIEGRGSGTEEFTIRRAGLGREDAIFANGVVNLGEAGTAQVIRPLLRATPPEGIATEYQVEVEGADSMTLRLRSAGRRYVAVIRSSVGEEQREFPAHEGTRVLEVDVAHHYYFLRNVREGSVTPVLEPRARTRGELLAGPSTDQELPSGSTVVESRRVEFSVDGETRTVWFDRLGRVLRVEIPARGYRAERVDLLR
jgi:hypothetical protein